MVSKLATRVWYKSQVASLIFQGPFPKAHLITCPLFLAQGSAWSAHKARVPAQQLAALEILANKTIMLEVETV